MKSTSVFKSEEGREKIRGYYNHILNYFPLEKRYVDTLYGKTFVLEAGSEKNPPIVLLHGSCSNSAAWLGDMKDLAEKYHVFAVDIPGEPGNSEENRLNIETDEYACWLSRVLDALGIEKAVVMGNSMGGWLALHFAAAYPMRTSALVLLAPSGIVPPRQAFMDKTSKLASNDGSAQEVTGAVMGDAAVPKEVLEFMMLVMDNFNPITDALPHLTDRQMRALTMPVLYIAAEGDVTMDVKEASKRLKSFVPNAKVSLIEGAHVITSAADKVIPFLAEEL